MEKQNRVIRLSIGTAKNTYWINDKEVTELEYYGIDENTTIEDLGGEPFNYNEFQEWSHKCNLVKGVQGDVSEFRKLIGF
tara:strand:+ start:285 stop:524 length:240 start_codon:yes stop_codon:yes gene_type:complete